MKRLPHVVEVASKMNPDPAQPIAIHYWCNGKLGSFFPMNYSPDDFQPKWNVTECLWIVPGTVAD